MLWFMIRKVHKYSGGGMEVVETCTKLEEQILAAIVIAVPLQSLVNDISWNGMSLAIVVSKHLQSASEFLWNYKVGEA